MVYLHKHLAFVEEMILCECICGCNGGEGAGKWEMQLSAMDYNNIPHCIVIMCIMSRVNGVGWKHYDV